MAKAGEIDKAIGLAAILKEDANDRWNTLSEIAEILAKEGKTKDAIDITMKIKDLRVKADAIVRVSQNLQLAGKKKEATATLQQALKQAQKIEKWYCRDSVIGSIVSTLVERGNLEQALKVTQQMEYHKFAFVSRSFDLTGKNPAYDRASAFEEITWAFVKAGNITRALETIQKIKDPSRKGLIISQTAFALVEKKISKKQSNCHDKLKSHPIRHGHFTASYKLRKIRAGN